MELSDRKSIIIATLFIGLGVLFLAFNAIPGLVTIPLWPLIFYLLAAGFYLPSLLWASDRNELAALHIPGSVMLALGLIFSYNTLTNDWGVWAYAWLLILVGVGLGIVMASWVGNWGKGTMWAGIWMMIISVMLFTFFSSIFGGRVLKICGSLLMILVGGLIIFRSFRKS